MKTNKVTTLSSSEIIVFDISSLLKRIKDPFSENPSTVKVLNIHHWLKSWYVESYFSVYMCATFFVSFQILLNICILVRALQSAWQLPQTNL